MVVVVARIVEAAAVVEGSGVQRVVLMAFVNVHGRGRERGSGGEVGHGRIGCDCLERVRVVNVVNVGVVVGNVVAHGRARRERVMAVVVVLGVGVGVGDGVEGGVVGVGVGVDVGVGGGGGCRGGRDGRADAAAAADADAGRSRGGVVDASRR